MPICTKEREAQLWDFKGNGGNSHMDEEEQTCSKQILATEAMGPNFAGFLPTYHT